ncbi:1169_t:CDS:2 [Paraglomus brasilianum]|uniref:1169_t:CDS:1 n=1 Tax=Paraglomus brasilianum TaxID=144538 RepID=A0A9N9AXJ0_9GLOM|nr:1169_t:CDS:2 [Paraglomus brasilianum]
MSQFVRKKLDYVKYANKLDKITLNTLEFPIEDLILELKKVKEVKKIQAEQEKERLKQAESEQKEKEKKFMEALKTKLKKV